jgi:hypothetical protein
MKFGKNPKKGNVTDFSMQVLEDDIHPRAYCPNLCLYSGAEMKAFTISAAM